MTKELEQYMNELSSKIGFDEIQRDIIILIGRELKKEENKEEIEVILREIYCILKNCQTINIGNKILVYSLLTHFSNKEKYMLDLAEYILQSDEIRWETLYYLYQKMAFQSFIKPSINTTKVNLLHWKILQKALSEFKKVTSLNLSPMKEEDLCNNMAIVITDQFLGYTHGPTKTTADRAYTLKNMFGNVFIINTGECLTNIGEVPYLYDFVRTYNDDLLNVETVEWKGKTFGYFQCEPIMPNEEMMGMLLDAIRKLKPSACVCVGGDSFFAGVVNEIIPTVAVGTTQSNLIKTLCDYQIADKYQIELDKELIREMNYEKNIIPGMFTFSLKESTHSYTREDIGISDSQFAIAMVGGRLYAEITDEFWEEMSKLHEENVVILTIGSYGKSEEVIKKYGDKIHIVDLGLCEDVIAILEQTDLYINPVRKGGATSAVEALSVGVPVLTVNYGDVAGTVGSAFRCDRLSEYSSMIKKYMKDKEFYEYQSKRAKEKAKELLDTDKVFREEVLEYIRRRKEG